MNGNNTHMIESADTQEPDIGSLWEYTLSGETYEVVGNNGIELTLKSKTNTKYVDMREWPHGYVQE